MGSRAEEPAYTWAGESLTRAELGAYIRPIYDRGMSVRRLAYLTGKSPAYIRALLVEHGATIRPTSPPRWRGSPAVRRAHEEAVASGRIKPRQNQGPRRLPILP
jgi:hypothetical protein